MSISTKKERLDLLSIIALPLFPWSLSNSESKNTTNLMVPHWDRPFQTGYLHCSSCSTPRQGLQRSVQHRSLIAEHTARHLQHIPCHRHPMERRPRLTNVLPGSREGNLSAYGTFYYTLPWLCNFKKHQCGNEVRLALYWIAKSFRRSWRENIQLSDMKWMRFLRLSQPRFVIFVHVAQPNPA